MNVLVTGSTGMLGYGIMTKAYKSPHYIFGYGHDTFDICIAKDVLETLRVNKVNVVINCAGIVKGRLESPADYILANALGPRVLASACDRVGARLIQISTDCVFTAQGHGPHTEMVLPNATDIYGRSKLLGEVEAPHLTIRTSFVGWGRRGLLHWLASQHGAVPGYTNVWWNGLTVPAFVDVLFALIDKPEVQGVRHVFGQIVSKHDLLCRLVDALDLDVQVYEHRDIRENRTLSTIYDLIEVPLLDEQIAMLR